MAHLLRPKRDPGFGDVLVSILDEKESHASFYLQREGISRLALLNYISHGVSVLASDGIGSVMRETVKAGEKRSGKTKKNRISSSGTTRRS